MGVLGFALHAPTPSHRGACASSTDPGGASWRDIPRSPRTYCACHLRFDDWHQPLQHGKLVFCNDRAVRATKAQSLALLPFCFKRFRCPPKLHRHGSEKLDNQRASLSLPNHGCHEPFHLLIDELCDACLFPPLLSAALSAARCVCSAFCSCLFLSACSSRRLFSCRRNSFCSRRSALIQASTSAFWVEGLKPEP